MKTKLIGLYIFLTFTVLLPFNTHAVPATPFPVKITQPDGSIITVRIHGDEFFNYKTTLDGYALIPDAAGILNYAKLNSIGNLVSTSIRATEIEKRSTTENRFIVSLNKNLDLSNLNIKGRAIKAQQKALSSVPQKSYPLTGAHKSIVILVNFTDKSFITASPKTAYTNLLNQSGYSTNGGTGSANDYFKVSSNGVFNPEFDVVGPFNLPNNMAFYGANDAKGNDLNAPQMIADACNAAFNSGVDFSQYDTDNDGIVDNVFVYYAGYNEAEGGAANSIWPHRWAIYPTVLYSGGNYSGSIASITFNGKRVLDYACTSELRGNVGSNMCGVGTFCHEFGHVLGLDDLYNTAGDNSYITLETFDIMDYGPYLNLGRTPPTYSAYERFFLNWLVPVELKQSTNVSLSPIISSNTAYLISQTGNHNLNGANPNPVEFFLLENRQNTGWDTYFGMNPNFSTSSQPAHGLYITHITYNQVTWSNNSPNNVANAMGVDVVRADGAASDATLAGDLFPGTSKVTSYNPALRNGTNLKKPLFNIKESNGIITFNFGPKISFTTNFQPFNTVAGTPTSPQTGIISGSKLQGAITLSFNTSQNFEIKKDTDPVTAWAKTLTIIPVDSTVSPTNIQIRYNPTVPSYNTTHSDLLMAKTNFGDYADAAVSGTSTRRIYVVPPVAKASTDTTYTSFVANWNVVADTTGYFVPGKYATGYYATVYNIADGTSNLTQGFDNGIVAPASWTITAATVSNSSVYSGANAPSIQFQNTGEYIQTEKYLLPVTTLSFFIRSLAGDNGGFLVQALNTQNKWEKVDSILVVPTLNEKARTYNFSETKGYNRFKFTYYKGIGAITFDDVHAGFSKQINYIQQDTWINTNSDTLTNLIPNTEYFYKIRASDKSVYYENITDFSNTISVKTLGYQRAFKSKDKTQIVYKTSNGKIIIKVLSKTDLIYIYNITGQQVIASITPQSDVIEIDNLPKNQFYIVKIGSESVKIVL